MILKGPARGKPLARLRRRAVRARTAGPTRAPHLARALELLAHFVRQLLARAAHQGGEVAQQHLVLIDVVERCLPGERLDAAHAGSDPALAHDLEEPDVAGALHVSAAAQLHRELTQAQYPHVLVVFLAKERDGAPGHRALIVHDTR